jgi:glycogen(starch) synthase
MDVVSRLGLTTALVPYPVPEVNRSAARPTDELQLVFAGRVEREKGVAEFLERMPADFSGRLTIVGEGEQLKRCRAVCRQRHLESRVVFTGRLPHAETLAIIARSHVLVLPSLWVENHPMSLLDALACGTNILTSDLGGMREIVDDSGIGFTFAPGDSAGLAASLDRISQAHRDDTLNRSDASAFLEARSEPRYLDALLAAYGP